MMSERDKEGPEVKKQKVDYCLHWIKRKERSCRLQKYEGTQYCAEHAALHDVTVSDRAHHNKPTLIPCPLDNKHYISADKLQAHLKVCNGNKWDYTSSPHYTENINVLPYTGEVPVKQSLSQILPHVLIPVLKKLIQYGPDSKLAPTYHSPDITEEQLARFSALWDEPLGASGLKHATQQVALVKLVEGLTAAPTTFVELGAGTGKMSQWFDAIDKDKHHNFVLIDRKNCRKKADKYFKHTDTHFQRFKMDIKDVDMFQLELVQQTSGVCVACKHLCGPATDLALVCATNQRPESTPNQKKDPSANQEAAHANFTGALANENLVKVTNGNAVPLPVVPPTGITKPGAIINVTSLGAGGNLTAVGTSSEETILQPQICVLIALCCHHVCDWKLFCDKTYFLQRFDISHFYILCSISAWATCFKLDKLNLSPDNVSTLVQGFSDNPSSFTVENHLVLDPSLRWYLGRCTKNILNDCRVNFMKERGFDVTIHRYCQIETSPENTAMLCLKKG